MFIDRAKIKIKAGDGGSGCMAFRREKFVPRGGPSGGDGGNGGNVYLEANSHLNTLLHFRYNPEYSAPRGQHGQGSNCSGRDGEDIIVKVPIGTLIKDAETGEVLADFVEEGQKILLAKGGRGGRGNAQFASSVNRAPRHWEVGSAGQTLNLELELKLLADVGIIGFPNAGKSTLISCISAAKPKIADYPFTTLTPNLGVVDVGDYNQFIIADIPGLIEGAHEGAGLGLQFLRHVERTKLLLHLIDVSSATNRDTIEDYQIITKELKAYSEDLANKPVIVIANKIDALDEPERLEKLQNFCKKQNLEFYKISAATGEGTKELIHIVAKKLKDLASS
ncbi:MAG: GTPase ObgE [Acidobacteria bacterium]|nr:GTPase ObgE [Acidobacteriota bacterium]